MILEYRKGYLFVRFNNSDIDSLKLINIIKSDNLYNIVINISDLDNLSSNIIKLLYKINNMVNDNKGNIYMCGSNKKILNISTINNELDVFKIGEII